MGTAEAGRLAFIRLSDFHSWDIDEPDTSFTIRMQTDSGRTWQSALQEPPRKAAERTRLGQELYAQMYPVTEPYWIWLENDLGERITGCVDPEMYMQFHRTVTHIIEHADGSVIVRRAIRRQYVHEIILGFSDTGRRRILYLEDKDWPPAFFFFGDKRVRVVPLTSLDQASINRFWEQKDEACRLLEGYTDTRCYITACDKPRFD